MPKYQVTYKGRTYTYTGEHTDDALAKFENRKVFGRDLVGRVHNPLIDADTYGKVWAQYRDQDNNLIAIKRLDK